MITVYHKHFEIEISSFINQQGNTSYMLDVFDYSRGGVLAYRLIRYQWRGGTNYLICADSDGWCFPALFASRNFWTGSIGRVFGVLLNSGSASTPLGLSLF